MKNRRLFLSKPLFVNPLVKIQSLMQEARSEDRGAALRSSSAKQCDWSTADMLGRRCRDLPGGWVLEMLQEAVRGDLSRN